jgi:hypothetical protein
MQNQRVTEDTGNPFRVCPPSGQQRFRFPISKLFPDSLISLDAGKFFRRSMQSAEKGFDSLEIDKTNDFG